MTKVEMIASMAQRAGITKADAERVINCTMELIATAIQEDGRCDVAGFGVFLKVRQEAVSRPNPQDRTKTVHTPARNTVRFRPAPALKATVNF